jgi:hypothetical protein
MEMQQMMERLLAEIRADREVEQEKADADRTKDREQILAEIRADRTKDRELLLSMQAKIDAETKAIRDKRMKANMNSCQKETTACQYEMEVSIRNMKSNPEEKETVLERHEIPNEEVTVHSLRTCQSETAASQEATETKPDPGTMQSAEEHQEIPKEDAAVMPVGGLRKRRRDRNLAAGRRQKPKRRIQANCESKTDRRWQKGIPPCNSGMAQETRLQKNCDPRKLWTAE